MTIILLPINYNYASTSTRRKARQQYAELQNNKCFLCREPLNAPPAAYVEEANIRNNLFPRGFFNNPVHLHHSHETNLTLGAVHARCNAYLWQYKGQ